MGLFGGGWGLVGVLGCWVLGVGGGWRLGVGGWRLGVGGALTHTPLAAQPRARDADRSS